MATTKSEKPVPSPFSGPNYSKNEGKCGDIAACAICGRPVKEHPGTQWAEVVDGGARFAAIAENAEAHADGGYMAFFPVGNDCARLFPAGYLRTFE